MAARAFPPRSRKRQRTGRNLKSDLKATISARKGKIGKKEKLSKTQAIAPLFHFLVVSVIPFSLWVEVLVQMFGYRVGFIVLRIPVVVDPLHSQAEADVRVQQRRVKSQD